MTADLIAFLRARLNEDERVARNAAPGPWVYQDIDSVGGGRICDPTVAIATIHFDNPGEVDPRIRRTIPEAQADETGAHIARWDPARVLADIEAKRRIIDEHPTIPEDWAWEVAGDCRTCSDPAPCKTVRLLAQPHAGHPDFNPDWAV